MSILRKTSVGFLFLFVIWGCSDSEFSSKGCTNPAECEEVVAQSISSWELGEWSRCSKACDGGEQTRTVQCLNTDKVEVPDSECSGAKPPSLKSCGDEACEDEFNWNVGPFGVCSHTCGGGTKSRVVTCQSKEGTYVSDSYCKSAKPSKSISCGLNPCPQEVFNWSPSPWSTCSATCDGGTYSRSVTCQNSSNVIVDESYCKAAKPSTNGTCNKQNCNYSYTWTTGSWGECNKKCSGGEQSRSIGCQRSDGVYRPHTLCTGDAPPITQACNTQSCPPTCTPKTISESVPATENQLDILVVVDDSGSMAQDNNKLAAKLAGFTNRLNSANLDWQMCITTTDVNYFNGRPIQWKDRNNNDLGHILKKTSGSLSTIFTKTVHWLGSGFSSDEQAIKAINLSLKDNNRSKCYRKKAGLAVIIISDEDERSVGGEKGLNPLQYKPLGTLNRPESVMNTAKEVFGSGKRVTVHPIIVKDNDCKVKQDAQGEMSFYGKKYKQLYNQIGGSLHSICAPDFSVSLKHCYNAIVASLSTVNLSCSPKEKPSVMVNGANYTNKTSVVGNKIIFNPVVEGPATITGSYCCQ